MPRPVPLQHVLMELHGRQQRVCWAAALVDDEPTAGRPVRSGSAWVTPSGGPPKQAKGESHGCSHNVAYGILWGFWNWGIFWMFLYFLAFFFAIFFGIFWHFFHLFCNFFFIVSFLLNFFSAIFWHFLELLMNPQLKMHNKNRKIQEQGLREGVP